MEFWAWICLAILFISTNGRDVLPEEDSLGRYLIPAEASFRKATLSCDKLATEPVRNYKYDGYLTFNQMEDRLNYLSCKYSTLMSKKEVGRSVEGEALFMVTIADGSANLRTASDMKDDDDRKEMDILPLLEESPHYEDPIRKQASSAGDYLANRNRFRPMRGSLHDKHLESTADDGLIRDKSTTFNEAMLKTGANNSPKIVIFIDAGIHAREWAAPAAAFYIIDKILQNPTRAHLDRIEWRIMPMANPDGYKFSHTSNRMWRKNRAKLSGFCGGVDLNRNFKVFWDQTERNKCSIQYGGPHAFSEPETIAIRDQINEVKGRVKAYVTFHTYGALILYPYGYTKTREPETLNQLVKMGKIMSNAIQRKHGSTYEVAQASIIGAAAGGSDDWAYISANVPYSYTFELQPSINRRFSLGMSGFDLPKDKLLKTVDEAWTAIEAMADNIVTQY